MYETPSNGQAPNAYIPALNVIKLNKEIKSFVHQVNRGLRDIRPLLNKVLRRVERQVGSQWFSATVEIYGSYLTGLFLPSSDLDVVIVGICDVTIDEAILKLARELKKQAWVLSLNAITSAKVPVIKLVAILDDRCKKITVDISFCEQDMQPRNQHGAHSAQPLYLQQMLPHFVPSFSPPKPSSPSSSNPSSPSTSMNSTKFDIQQPIHSGIATSNLIKSYFKCLPFLRPMALVMKQFLVDNDLNDTYTGGLSSYCMVMMIISFLQFRAAGQITPYTLGGLGTVLMECLNFYAYYFDYQTWGLRVNLPTDYQRNWKSPILPNVFFLDYPSKTLVIEDPLNPSNNIANSVFQMWRISDAFKQTLESLHAKLLIRPEPENSSYVFLSTIINVEKHKQMKRNRL